MTARRVHLAIQAALLLVVGRVEAAILQAHVERSAVVRAAGHPDRAQCSSSLESLRGREPWRGEPDRSTVLLLPPEAEKRSTSLAASGGRLGPGTVISLPATIHDLSTADLDRDGDVDFVGVAYWGGKLILGWNDGRGKFETREIEVARPRQVGIGDFDGDRVADLLVLREIDPGSILILKGRPGGFDSVGTRAVGTYLYDLVSTDLDGDGYEDFAMADDGRSIVVLRSSDGFSSAESHPAWDPWELAPADLDRDGAIDLVTSTGCGTVDVYFNDGAGRFDTPVVFLARAFTSLATGDFDADGWCDVVGTWFGYGVSVMWNDGHGYFEGRDDHATAWMEAPDLAAADLDRDGRLDFVLSAGGSARQLSWIRPFFQRDDRSFDGSTSYNAQPGEYDRFRHLSLAVADLDRRRGPEILAGLYDPQDVTGRALILKHIAGRAFAGMALIATSAPVSIRALDLLGRGQPELLVNQGSDSYVISCSPNDGLPGEVRPFPLGAGAGIHDFNVDGRSDLIHAVAGGFEIRLTGVDGVPGSPRFHAQSFPSALGDFDADGLPDLVSRGPDDTLLVALNDGTGAFDEPLRTDASVTPRGHWENPFAFGDVDGDGDTDLLLGRLVDPLNWDEPVRPDTIEVWRCEAITHFRHVGSYPVVAGGDPRSPLRLREIVASDMDGNGLVDVVGISAIWNHWGMASVLPSLGSGILGNPIGVMLPSESPVVLVHDVTGDPYPDLLAFGSVDGGTLKIATNRGDGTFDEPQGYLACPDYVGSVAAGDFNGDGAPDVAFAHQGYAGDDPGMGLLLQDPDREVTSMQRLTLEATVRSGVVALRAYGPSDTHGDVWIERREPTTPWRRIAQVRRDGPQVAFEDRSVSPGASYLYRILWEGGPSGSWLSDEVAVTLPSGDLGIVFEGPHPARRSVIVRFGWIGPEPGRVELLDTAGRRWEAMTVPSAAPRWELGRGVPSGLYWIRFSQGGRSVTRKVVITR